MRKLLLFFLPFLCCFQLSIAQNTQFVFEYDAGAQNNPDLINAVEYAFDIWSNEIVSSVPITVQVNYINLGFFAAGNAQTESFQFGFQGAPDPNIKYPVALANEFAQTDLNGAAPEIIMNLNSTTSFYYGTDANPPANQFDLVSVVLHEACHALGFFSEARVNGSGEGEFAGFLPYIYDTFLVDANGNKLLDIPENTTQLGNALTNGQVFMDGENAKAALGGNRPQISANNYTEGSSISHWNLTTYLGTDNSLMTPATFNGSAQHNVGDITRGQMADIGWTLSAGNGGSTDFTDAFITKWQTTTVNESITIPTFNFPGEIYDYTVDWGDGTIENALNSDATHSYLSPGIHTVSITGDFPRIYFLNNNVAASNREKILSIEQWGSNEWTSMEYAFFGAVNLDVVTSDIPDFSGLENLDQMFSGCSSLIGNTSFNDWDLSTITRMSSMFLGASSFNQNISSWNVENVQLMFALFGNATSYNQPLSTWDVRNVNSMRFMFEGASSFNQPLDNWDVSQVTDMGGMFKGATAFNKSLTSWNVDQVTRMEQMFSGALSFNQSLSSWNVENVRDMESMFGGATSFNQDISSWDVGKVENMYSMFANATNFDQNLGSWDIGSLVPGSFDPFTGVPENSSVMNFLTNSGVSSANYDALLIGWGTLDTAAGETRIPNDIILNAGGIQYCAGKEIRQILRTTFNWEISDGGENCPESEAILEPDGTLTINDTNGGDSDDEYSFSTNGTNLVFSSNSSISISGEGVIQVDANTVEIPIAGITKGLVLDGGEGNNTLNLDTSLYLLGPENGLTLTNLNVKLNGTGELQLNSLNITGGNYDTNGLTTTVTTEANFFTDATLSGTGTINGIVNMNAGSNLAPGVSPGILNTGDLVLDNSNNNFEVDGPTPGTEHDQVVVTGTVTIAAGTSLNLLNGYANGDTDEIILIDNDGTDAITGIFATLAEGDDIAFGSFTGSISYVGGDGNDISLSGLDETAPNLVGFTPIDNTSDIPLDTNLVLTFDEPVQLSGEQFLNFNILNITDGRVEANKFYLDITINGNVVTVDPIRNLSPNKEYSIGIQENFFQDLSGNAVLEYDGYNSPYSFSTLTTLDDTQPTLVSVLPDDNAVDVPIDTNILMTFSEDVQIQQNPGVFRLFRILGTGIPEPSDIEFLEDLPGEGSGVLVSGSSIELNFNTDFEPNTKYLIQLAFYDTVIEDMFGNPWYADLEPEFESPGLDNLGYIFTTGMAINDTEAPVISCPESITSTAGTNCSTMVPLNEPTATDNFSTTFTYNGVRSDGSPLTDPFFFGETTITWTATDEAGNVSESCEQVITVNSSGNCWEKVGGDLISAGDADNLSFAKDANGVLYVAYRDYTIGGISVSRFQNGVWETIGDPVYVDNGFLSPQLAISLDGVPHVSYYDNQQGRHIIKRFGNGVWEDFAGTIEGASFEYGNGSIAFNQSNELHILYLTTGNKHTLKKWDGNAWITIGQTAFSNAGLVYRLAFDTTGTPYVSYQETDITPQRLTVQRFNGTNWEFVGTAAFTQGIGAYHALGIAPNNLPYVAYYDSGGTNIVQVARFNGTVWEQVGNSPYQGAVTSLSIDFDAGGTPYIGFKANTNIRTVVRLENNAWVSLEQSIAPSVTNDFFENMQICLDNSDGQNPIVYAIYAQDGIYVKSYQADLLDTETPQITCPENLEIVIIETETNATVTLEDPTATDNVSTNFTFTGTRSDALALTEPFSIGETTISWTATDEAGNTSLSCDQIVSVMEAESEAALSTDGSLTITDTNGGVSDDSFTLAFDNDNLVLTNTTPIAISGDGVVQVDANTVQIPLASITNGLTLNGGSGTNTLLLDTSLAFLGTDNFLTLNNLTIQLTGTETLELNTLNVTGGNFDTNGLTTTVTTEANFFTDATLSGTGSINGIVNMNAGSNLAPGTSPGILNTGDLVLDNSNNNFEVEGPTPGTEHDQIVVTGTVTIVAGTTLNLLNGYANGDTAEIILIDNDGNDAITGTFDALAEGDNVAFGNFNGTISYVGGDGNDLVLFGENTVVEPPITENEWLPLGPNDDWPSVGQALYTQIALTGDGTPYVVYQDNSNGNKATVQRYNESSWEVVGTAGFSAGPAVYTDIAISGDGTPYVIYRDVSNGSKATVQRYNGTSWEVVGTAGFSAGLVIYPEIALTGDGTPYVVYVDGSNGLRATVQRYNGTSWEVVGTAGFSAGGGANYTEIALTADGTPYVVYSEGSNESKATVQRYNGSSWEVVGTAGFSAGRADFTEIALTGDGAPYVVYRDGSNGFKATVQRYNGISWEVVGTAGFSAGQAIYTEFVLTGDGTPYVVYRDGSNGSKATVQRYNGSSWEVVGTAGFSAGRADFTEIGLTGDGTPYVVYVNRSNGSKATVQRYNGSTWEIVGSAGFSAGGANYTEIALSGDGTPYVVYQDNSNGFKATVQRYNVSGWEVVGTAGFSAGRVDFTNISLSGDGTPYVVYRDASNSNDSDKATVQRYNGSSWEVVGTPGFAAAYETDIALSGDGTPYIVYQHVSNGLKATVQRYNGSSWEVVGAAGFSAGLVLNAEIALSGDGTPYVVYGDGSNGNKATVQRYNGSSWEVVGTAGFSAGGAIYTEIALTGDGTPYVVYGDGSNGNKATVQRYNGSSWEVVGTAGFSVGRVDFTNVALTGDGTPYVVYRDRSNGNKATVQRYNGTSWELVGNEGFTNGEANSTSMAIDDQGTITVVYSSGFAYAKTYSTAPLDSTSPILATTAPEDNAVDIELNASLTLTFDEPVQWQQTAAPIIVYDVTNEVAFASLEETSTELSLLGSELVIDLEQDFEPNNTYEIRIGALTFEDASGNAFAGIANGDWSFTTVPPVCTLAITEQPQSTAICEEETTLEFAVVATGTGTLSYNWQALGNGLTEWTAIGVQNGNAILALTSPIQLEASGLQYRVVITDDQGTPETEDDCEVISNAAILTVNPKPEPEITGLNSYNEGAIGVVLDAGAGFTTYLWSNGETTQTIQALEGEYTVEVSNENGCIGISEIFEVTKIESDLLITEIMYNPANSDNAWEYIEVYNKSNLPIDLSGYVIDNNTGAVYTEANIVSGIVAPNSSAIIFDGSVRTSEQFKEGWGDVNTIPATTFSTLNNDGDTIGIWDSFESYEGDNETQLYVIEQVVYENNVSGWPDDDGFASIYLTDLSLDNNLGSSWSLSVVGEETPVNTTYSFSPFGNNAGLDVGSPGIPVLIDDQPPTVFCPVAVTVQNEIGSCSAIFPIVPATATDNVSLPENISIDFVRSDGELLTLTDPYPVGETIITWTATDEEGNVSLGCEQIITVEDGEAPTAVAQDITLQLDENGEATLIAKDLDNELIPSSDNCTPMEELTYNVSKTSFDCSDIGTPVTVFFFVTDAYGNESTAVTAEVTVVDGTAPVLTCGGIIIESSLSGQPLVIEVIPPTVLDNCDETLVVSGIATLPNETTFILGSTENSYEFPEGTTTIVWSAEDASENIGTCEQTVTVNFTPSTASSIQSFDITGQEGATVITGTSVEVTMPFGTDVSGLSPTIAVSEFATVDPASGENVDFTTGPVTYTVTAQDGSFTEYTVSITVLEDTTPPSAICQNMIVELDANGQATITAADIDGGSTDNVGIASLSITPLTFNEANIGDNQVTLTVTDTNGNSSTCNAIVTVKEFICPIEIISQPQNVEICEGETSLQFSVLASGAGILDYNWQLLENGQTEWIDVAEQDRTSILNLTNPVQLADSGLQYRVIITDDQGTAITNDDCQLISNAAILTINSKPVLVIVGDTTYEEGGTGVVLNAGAGYESYLWSTGETTQTITALQGEYTVEVIDDNGCIGISDVFEVEEVPIPDTTAPIITLNGANPQEIELGAGYTELGATTDDGSPITIDTSAFEDAVGIYEVTYNATDASGNVALEVVRTVEVVESLIAWNEPDEDVNLGLSDDSVLDGTVSGGRGTLEAILYDPVADDYVTRTEWNEYGVAFRQNLGRPTVEDGFRWQIDWETPKRINYITFGGTYPNQPQPNSMWRISYERNGVWTILEEGQGGWIDSGIFEWGGIEQPPIEADALRVQIYSDGTNDLVSIHLRGRGGISNRINDSGTATKATLIQYLPGGPGPDVIAPVITLNGANPQEIELGTGYTELGATTDDGSPITIDTSAFMDALGSYTIVYNSTDGINEAEPVFRTVTVVNTTAPIITLNGANPQEIELGAGYTELGATTDDGSPITIDTSAFEDAVGIYEVTYNATDASGNVALEVVRTVEVVESLIAWNEPDEDVNLGLSDDSVLDGTVSGGRGTLEAILYDPVADDYVTRTEWNEYGVAFRQNLGRPTVEDGFRWQIDWETPKRINYITFGGTYPNQPQPNSMWRISYERNGVWTILEEGQGGWIDSGIFEWGGIEQSPVEADALRVQIYSDGTNDLVSIHLRGRGGISNRINDSGTATKATLIQYLPSNTITAKTMAKPINNMLVYPNPAYMETSLSFDKPTNTSLIQVFDITGRLVQTIEGGIIDNNGIPVNVQDLPAGLYYIKTVDNLGNKYERKMLIKR